MVSVTATTLAMVFPRDADGERTAWNPVSWCPVRFERGAGPLQVLEHDHLKLDKTSTDPRR